MPVVAVLGGQYLASGAPPTALTPNGLGTMVTARPLQPAGTYYNISGGTVAGSNLFHSFSTFNLGTGDTADFNVSNQISNILARVTGGPSIIDGTLTSTNATTGRLSSANLFLINPAGLMFTANAQVNLGGSLIVSTADYVKFSNGSIFYGDVNHPIQDAGLSSAPVSAFGFLTPTPQPISFAGSQINMQPGTGLHVIGGDIGVDQGSPDGVHEQGATLLAPSGNLTLFSAASAGEVPFSLASPGAGFANATNTSFGAITVKNQSSIAIDGAGGGSMIIRGGRIVVDNSTLSSGNSGSGNGGNISVQADQLSVSDAGSISTQANGSGPGGDIDVLAGAVNIDGGLESSGAFNASNIASVTNGAGNGGNLNFTLTGALTLTNGGLLNARSNSAGTGGKISVAANAVSVDGGFIDATGDFNSSEISSSAHGSGNGGNLSLTLLTDPGTLSLTNGGKLDAGAFGSSVTGTGGDISVQANALRVDGGIVDGNGNFNASDISTSAEEMGNAGNITLILTTGTGALTLTNGGEIDAGSSGSGYGGDLNVQANSISIDGGTYDGNGNLFASEISSMALGTGNAGNLNIMVTTGPGTISMTNGGEVNFGTSAEGNGGNLTLEADTVSIDGTNSGIGSFTSASGATGNITLILTTGAGTLSLTNGGEINTGTYGGSGAGGNIIVRANSIMIDGLTSGLLSFTNGSGPAGFISVNLTTGAGSLSLTSGGAINADTFGGAISDDITVTANSVSIDGGFIDSSGNFNASNISTSASGTSSAGNINFILTTGPGTLSLTNGGGINAGTSGSGNGGDVTVQANAVSIDGGGVDSYGNFQYSEISSLTFGSGNAGGVNFILTTGPGTLSLTNGGTIDTGTNSTTIAGNGGNIAVQANAVIIDGGFVDSYGNFNPSDISSSAQSMGNSGNINLTLTTGAGALALTRGGEINAGTYGIGIGGAVTVRADTVSIDGGAYDAYGNFFVSEISSSTSGMGNAGTINFALTTGAGALSITNGGEIIAGTSDAGSGGDIIVQANTAQITGGPFFDPSEVTSSTSGSGSAGIVDFNLTTGAGSLSLGDGGEVSVATSATGSGGNIALQVNTLQLDNNAVVSSQASASGPGGGINVTTSGAVSLTGGSMINASSAQSDAGSIQLVASSLTLKGNSLITTSAQSGNGGDIQLQVGGILYLLSSGITASAFGTGGNITIDPQFVVLDDSFISAFGGVSNGNIIIDTNHLLENDSSVTASGTITISAPDLDLSGSLIALPATLESDEKRLRESCARSVNHEFSTFIVVGRGGTETAPEELQPDFGFDEFTASRSR